MADPERVRLLVVVDWDVGFVLTAHPPLPDVAPGDAYVTECFPQHPVTLHEVLVVSFALVQISIGTRTIPATVELLPAIVGQQGPRRLYRLHEPIIVDTENGVRVHLCNDSVEPRKQKSITLVRDVAAE